MSYYESRVNAKLSLSMSQPRRKSDFSAVKQTKKRHSQPGGSTARNVGFTSNTPFGVEELVVPSIHSTQESQTPLRATTTPSKSKKKTPLRRSSKPKVTSFARTFRSRSRRAGIIFPAGRVQSNLRRRFSRRFRVGVGAAIYLSAVMEYLVAEVVELGGYMSARDKRVRINPRHVMLAVRTDEELNAFVGKSTFAQAGVVPHIPLALLDGKKFETTRPSFALSSTLPI